MTVAVKANSSKTIAVTQGSGAQASIVVKKPANVPTIESIGNVSSVDLSDGDSLVYNATTNKWETKPVSLAAGNIDGGTY